MKINNNRKLDEAPEMYELECLIAWPSNTVGASNEEKAICTLIKIAKEIGFGRMLQLAEGIEDIWRNPEAVNKYFKQKENRFKQLEWEI